jgi:hypothetical protein
MKGASTEGDFQLQTGELQMQAFESLTRSGDHRRG